MREITSVWQTDELRRHKPTPVDEARAGNLFVFWICHKMWVLVLCRFVFIYILWLFCFVYIRLEHCGAIPLESCTSLSTSCQQCSKKGLSFVWVWSCQFFFLHIWSSIPFILSYYLLFQHTGKPLPLTCAPIRFGSWMGGDRDGNPNVTAKVRHFKMFALYLGWVKISTIDKIIWNDKYSKTLVVE